MNVLHQVTRTVLFSSTHLKHVAGPDLATVWQTQRTERVDKIVVQIQREIDNLTLNGDGDCYKKFK